MNTQAQRPVPQQTTDTGRLRARLARIFNGRSAPSACLDGGTGAPAVESLAGEGELGDRVRRQGECTEAGVPCAVAAGAAGRSDSRSEPGGVPPVRSLLARCVGVVVFVARAALVSARVLPGRGAPSESCVSVPLACRLRRVLAVLALSAGMSLGVVVAPALASLTYTVSGSFGSAGFDAGQLAFPRGLAVDQSTGDVYVADAFNHRIDKFDAAGNFLLAWGWGVTDGAQRAEVCTASCQRGIATNGSGASGFAAGGFTLPVAVAVDNNPLSPSYRDVYVADYFNNVVVQKFSPAGAFLGTLVPDFQFASQFGVATDTAGNVWLNDGSTGVSRWSSTGATLPSQRQLGWDTFGNGGLNWLTGYQPSFGFAVDAGGDVFAVHSGVTEKFAGDGSDLGEVDPTNESARALSADLEQNLLYDAQGSRVEVYDTTASLPATPLASFGSFGSAAGVAVDSASGMVYVADDATNTVEIFKQTGVPNLAAGLPSSVQPTAATLNGTVDPVGGSLSDCHFDYVDDGHYDPTAVNPYAQGNAAPCASSPSGAGPLPVSADLSGLSPDTTFHFRLVAANSSGTAEGADRTFATTGPPTVAATRASSASAASTRVEARVNPHGFDTQVSFEYGTSPAYGQSAPGAGIGSGTQPRDAGTTLSGLSPGTTYHFRVLATSSQGTVDGPDQTFTTAAACPNTALRTGYSTALPDCRAYEQVTPVNKDSQVPNVPSPGGMQGDLAAVDGNRVAWTSVGGLPGSQFPGLYYLSVRSSGGWSTANQIPPQSTENGTECGEASVVYAYSPDLTSHVLADGAGQDTGAGCGHDDPLLVPGEPTGVQNLFLSDPLSGYLLLSPNPVSGSPIDASYVAASPDLSHVLFESSAKLTADAQTYASGGGTNLYEWSAGGGVHLVNVLPNGSEASCSFCVPTSGLPNVHVISADGSKVFFQSDNGNLYVRIDDSRTVQVDASQAGGLGGGGTFQWASADGSQVYFVAGAGAGLTADTVPGSGSNLYRYNLATGQLTDLTPASSAGVGGGKDGVLGTSDDGSYVYFVASGALAPGARAGTCANINAGIELGTCSLYVWHDGTTRFIAQVSGADWRDWDQSGDIVQARVSPDGRYLAFDSQQSLAGADTGGYQQIYLYDAASGQLTCASCSPTGAPGTHAVLLGPGIGVTASTTTLAFSSENGGFTLERNLAVTSSGAARVFFQTPEPLLPAAVNGVQNVYEYETDGGGSCHQSGGCLYLISSGSSSADSVFLDASATGDDVFIATAQRLTSSDTDQSLDVYDARVNGGLPASTPPSFCTGDACKGPLGTPPPPPPAATVTFFGPGNAASSSRPPGTARVLTRTVHGPSFLVKVNVPGAGRITIAGPEVRIVRRSVAHAGTYRLRMKVTGAARRALTRRHKLRLTLRVRYAPPGSGAQSATVRLTLLPAIHHTVRHVRGARRHRAGTR